MIPGGINFFLRFGKGKETMKIQWYPGHMTKAKRAMQEDIKLIDLIIEMRDARIPLASSNPDIAKLGAAKSRIIILNKADMAEEEINAQWVAYFKERGTECMLLDSRQKHIVKKLQPLIEKASAAKRERDLKRGILNRPVRAMVAGIPNVGKSTLINSIAGRASAKTGNKPGVTKGNQWIRLNKNIELLDTPGILWPKFEDEHVGTMIAFIGSINDLIIDVRELAVELLNFLLRRKHQLLEERFGSEFIQKDALSCLQEIALRRGCLKKGGELDLEKAANLFLTEFRNAKLGRISLEKPEDFADEREIE